MSSNVSTPNLEPQQTVQPVSPSPLATNKPQNALDDEIPPLSLGVLSEREEKVDALRLIADSIAQQRQLASLTLVSHPLMLAVLVLLLAMVYQFSWVYRKQDLGMALSMGSGAIMIYLMTIRYFASGYVAEAEKLKWEWLTAEDGEEDVIIGTRFGEDMIGTLVLRLEPKDPSLTGSKKKHNRSGSGALKGGRGVIRAWTTRLRFRGKGVGTDMLQEAVRITRERCGKDAEVGFAAEHANSVMLLPGMFNKPFRKREMKAARALESVLEESEGTKRKR
jgi:hypothetical protein